MNNKVKNQFSKLYNLSLNKQFLFFTVMAIAIVGIISAINWVKAPEYTMLFSTLSANDQQPVMKVLDENAIPYKILPSSGGVSVPFNDVSKARMMLAKKGLPSSYQDGYDLLTKSSGIYTNQMSEELLKKKILEDNLKKAIGTISGVESVKVQLALPKHTEFMQKQNEPKASVILQLQPGVTLTDVQVQGIAHLVSSSIPYMHPSDVTIVDQSGALLSADNANKIEIAGNEMKYRTQLEEKLRQQILHVLTPIVGNDNLRVEVNTTLDFNRQSNTTEKYLPNKNAVESEQIDNSEQVQNTGAASGVPGALSNQPPGQSKFSKKAVKSKSPGEQQATYPLNKHDKSTMNYALGKSITHTSFSSGVLKRLSIAILLNKIAVEKGKKVTYVDLPKLEIDQIISLAKHAVGFDRHRGDEIAVSSAKFNLPAPIDTEDEDITVPMMQQVWFLQLIKGGIALAGIILFALFIWRPFQKIIFESSKESEFKKSANGQMNNAEQRAGDTPNQQPVDPFENAFSQTKDVVNNKPEVAADIVKSWINPRN